MRKFICKLIIFAAILGVLDIAVGVSCKYLAGHAKGGETRLNNYICNELTDDIIIMGSSRGVHHYDPAILTDSLSLSCFNCSMDGNGIVLMYGRWKMLSERYIPKVLVYDILPAFDIYISDNHRYLASLRYYYNRPGIDSLFWSVDRIERYKMLSNFYRYNSSFIQLISDNLKAEPFPSGGYKPIDKEMVFSIAADEFDKRDQKCDSLKIRCLRQLVGECKSKGTRIVFMVSPMYGVTCDKALKPVKDLCKEIGVPLISHYSDTAYATHPEYFSDPTHLNRVGATKYTKDIVAELRKFVQQ